MEATWPTMLHWVNHVQALVRCASGRMRGQACLTVILREGLPL